MDQIWVSDLLAPRPFAGIQWIGNVADQIRLFNTSRNGLKQLPKVSFQYTQRRFVKTSECIRFLAHFDQNFWSIPGVFTKRHFITQRLVERG